ncbi:hypothetical protein [Tetragenococcus halophilus]|uniref:Uncharacterized protein n=4 Tax=Tetragenococcus halophilus TaxID=51669 RepID=A0A2H6DBR6_TETHA|nr:hypothetical protein [Tetragenococcus halophilus]AOF48664.1 hypothetical protein AC806_04285 [Tetragenococcus halophilus]AYW50266.1 hypothetical protein C7H83_07230 [Tetragenococcus halophilus]MCF1600857.1 hypothetical protein [Tetragenococcus halophilus]MCF1676771.1 hypothetical protein [Tetragenococcus halophilus]MCF1686111.1 hypothetical protein [Tetragenococcus halophilus]
MKKSKKEKKKLLAKQHASDHLASLKQEISTMLSFNLNPYMVFALYIMERFEYTHVEKMKPDVTQFMDNYYLDFPDLDKIMDHIELREAFNSYLQIVQYYYLLTTTSGKEEFEKIVEWLPTENKQRQTLLSWPDNYIISLFHPIISEGTLYFQDLKDQNNYDVYVEDGSELMDIIQEKQPTFLSLLFPTENGYTISPLVECQHFDNLKDILDNDLPKTKWESELFLWYRDNLSYILNSATLDPFGEDLLPEFYSAERFANESDTDFADRLLDQDPMFENFPYVLELKQLLVKVIQTFPQLFIARANVFPLLDALKVLFSDIEIESKIDEYLGDSLSHFWILLILEYLPEEVKMIEEFKVDPDDWTDYDDLDLPF